LHQLEQVDLSVEGLIVAAAFAMPDAPRL